MLPTEFYIAAFAAFLIPQATRLPALLCALIQCVTLNFESLPIESYEYYYAVAFWSSFISCKIILYGVVTRQKIEHAVLFFAACLTDAFGLILFVNYCEPAPYNVTGFYVILTQMLILFRDGHGEITDVVADTVHAFRNHLSIQRNQGKK